MLKNTITEAMPARRSASTVCYAHAKENPWELYTVKELAAIHCVSDEVIACCFKMGAKNHFGMSRPEWVLEFLYKYDGERLQCKSSAKEPRERKIVVLKLPKSGKQPA